MDYNRPTAKTTDSDALMDQIRKNPPAVKSISEVVSLLRAISTEQRSCNVLRSCVDKVLLNMSNIRTLRDIIERLRSVSRTNGFRFEIPSSASPETRCHLVSDMFSVKIVLGTSNTPDHSPVVLDVSIKHKEDYRSCPHLANVIRAGDFLELSNHLKGLMEMYSNSGSRQSKTRIFLALQSLETDIVKMSQMYRDTHSDSSTFDITMRGTVGFLTPRLAGDRPHFAYYVSPYDLIDISTSRRIILTDKVPRDIGLHAEIGIEQRNTSCNLPISPLITNKHPIDNSGMPRFMEVSHHNSTNVQSCFVLYLKPPVPVLQKVASDICQVTGFKPTSADGSTKNFLELLGATKNTYKVLVGDDVHVYHLALSDLTAMLVNKVHFTHPAHVSKILGYLRKQSHLNTAISSCIRDFSGRSKGREWYFEVSCDTGIERLNITMEHPSSTSTAFLEVKLNQTGFPNCKIFTSRGDPPLCNDDFVVQVLEKCCSLPITMRKLLERSRSNPRRELDSARARPPALFSSLPPNIPPNILTPVPNRFAQQAQQTHHPAASDPIATSDILPSSGMSFHPTAADPGGATFPKKAIKNPMLTDLLKKEPPEPHQRSNPMLLTLLKENTEEGRMDKANSQLNQLTGMLGGNQHISSTANSNSLAFISAVSTFPTLDSTMSSTSHTMPPPSYPNSAPQNQFAPTSMPAMSTTLVPNSPYSMQQSPMSTVDDVVGPVTPTNPFGVMSPGLISPVMGMSQSRGRKASRQKSQSIETHDFPTMDTPQYESQPSVESDISMDIFNMNNRPGMTPLRRTESMSPSSNLSMHQPLHSMLTKTVSDNPANINLLTRSASVNSVKSTRSITSPVPRGLRTPEGMVTLGSPPMFDVNLPRGSRVKSFESHASDYFRSPLASASPGTQAGMNAAGGMEQDPDPFSFDDNKNTSKISMSDTSSQSGRTSRPSLYQSNSFEKEEALKEYQKTKPVLYRALTGDSSVPKPEPSPLQRQLSGTGHMSGLSSTPTTPLSATSASSFDFPAKLMTSTSITTIGEKPFGKPNVMEKSIQSNQAKAAETKSEKAVKFRRNSNKNDDGKPTGKKRGRPPAKDASGKKRKVEVPSSHDDSSSNPPIMLNIQLSSTGAPISSTTKTKSQPTAIPMNKNIGSVGAASNVAAPNSNANAGNSASAATSAPIPAFDGPLGSYLQSQQEFQKRKEMKDKKGVGKALVTKQSFTGQATAIPSNAAEKNNAASTLAKAGTQQRTVLGLPAPRKRKASIKDIADKLQSKISETNVGSAASPPGNAKPSTEKEVGLITKVKASLPYQKVAHGGFVGKAGVKSPVDDKLIKGVIGHKTAKVLVPKILPNAAILQKQAGFNQGGSIKSIRSAGGGMDEVLKHINEAAAATAKRNPMQTTMVKPTAGKVARPSPSMKPRSVTPTNTGSAMAQLQRKSPSQMMRTFSETNTQRNASIKFSPGPHRPSPTHSRISTPIPANSPQSPDRLLIIDDPAFPLLRDEQRPDFISGSKANERQSPERATVATPMSPPPSAQKTNAAMGYPVKTAPASRSHIPSPAMSPLAVSSPLSSLDDDLMNQAVTG